MPEHPENSKKLVEKVKKYKDWKLTVYVFTDESLVNKKKFNLKKKSPKSNVYGLN